jgi:hypothetical protein
MGNMPEKIWAHEMSMNTRGRHGGWVDHEGKERTEYTRSDLISRADGWRPIETAKTSEWIILKYKIYAGIGYDTVIAKRVENNGGGPVFYFVDAFEQSVPYPEGWMPIPKPPQAEEK